MSVIELISEDIIKQNSWKVAYELTSDIDEDDTPFVALTIDMNGILWTGDKKLINGLRLKGFKDILSTRELHNLRGY